MDDIQQQLDDINSRLDDNDSSLQDFSDNLDDSLNDINDNIDDINNNVDELQGNEGQLLFPLTQDTIDLIMEQFPRGQITLVSGTATIIDPRISSNSLIFLTMAVGNGTPGFLTSIPSNGQAIIKSFSTPSNADNSTINYLILPQ